MGRRERVTEYVRNLDIHTLASMLVDLEDARAKERRSALAADQRGEGEAMARAIRDAYSCGYSAGCAGAPNSVRVSDLEGLIAAHPTPPPPATVDAGMVRLENDRQWVAALSVLAFDDRRRVLEAFNAASAAKARPA